MSHTNEEIEAYLDEIFADQTVTVDVDHSQTIEQDDSVTKLLGGQRLSFMLGADFDMDYEEESFKHTSTARSFSTYTDEYLPNAVSTSHSFSQSSFRELLASEKPEALVHVPNNKYVLDTKEDARVNDELDSDTEEEEDKDNGANVDKGLDSEDDDGEEDEDEEDECDYGHVYRNCTHQRALRKITLYRYAGCVITGKIIGTQAHHVQFFRHLKRDKDLTKYMFDPNCTILLSSEWACYFDRGLACIHPTKRRLVISDVVIKENPEYEHYFGLDMRDCKVDAIHLEWAWDNMKLELLCYDKSPQEYEDKLDHLEKTGDWTKLEQTRKDNMKQNRTRDDQFRLPNTDQVARAISLLRREARNYKPELPNQQRSYHQHKILMLNYRGDDYSESFAQSLAVKTGLTIPQTQKWLAGQRLKRGESKHHLTEEQSEVLREAYTKDICPSESRREQLAKVIGVDQNRVKNWFTSERQRNGDVKKKFSKETKKIILEAWEKEQETGEIMDDEAVAKHAGITVQQVVSFTYKLHDSERLSSLRATLQKKPPLFKGYNFMLQIEDKEVETRISQKITANGGKIKRIRSKNVKQCVFESDNYPKFNKLKKKGMILITSKWVEESVAKSELQSIAQFTALEPKKKQRRNTNALKPKKSKKQSREEEPGDSEPSRKKTKTSNASKRKSTTSIEVPTVTAPTANNVMTSTVASTSEAHTAQPAEVAPPQKRKVTRAVSNSINSTVVTPTRWNFKPSQDPSLEPQTRVDNTVVLSTTSNFTPTQVPIAIASAKHTPVRSQVSNKASALGKLSFLPFQAPDIPLDVPPQTSKHSTQQVLCSVQGCNNKSTSRFVASLKQTVPLKQGCSISDRICDSCYFKQLHSSKKKTFKN